MKKTGDKVDGGDFNSLPVTGRKKNDLKGSETGKVLRRRTGSRDYRKQTVAMRLGEGWVREWGRWGLE